MCGQSNILWHIITLPMWPPSTEPTPAEGGDLGGWERLMSHAFRMVLLPASGMAVLLVKAKLTFGKILEVKV